MAKRRWFLSGTLCMALAAGLVAGPVRAQQTFPDPRLPASAPPVPAPAPGETQIPPVGNASEDDMPTSGTERQQALNELRGVAACVRALGIDIPDPVSDTDGVHLSWTGPPRPATEAAIERCRTEAAARP